MDLARTQEGSRGETPLIYTSSRGGQSETMERSKHEAILLNGRDLCPFASPPSFPPHPHTPGKKSPLPHPGVLPLPFAASPFSPQQTCRTPHRETKSSGETCYPFETRALLSFPPPSPSQCRQQAVSGKAAAGVRLKRSPLSSGVYLGK